MTRHAAVVVAGLSVATAAVPALAQADATQPQPETVSNQPPIVQRLAERLSTAPWAAVMRVDGTEDLALAIRFDPTGGSDGGPITRLLFPTVNVVVENGVLTAEAAGAEPPNLGPIAVIERDATLTELITEELPPLFAPPLAIALSGDAGTHPIIGRSQTPSIEWVFASAENGRRTFVARDRAGTRVEMTLTERPGSGPTLAQYAYGDGAIVEIASISAGDSETWRIDWFGRERVASLDALETPEMLEAADAPLVIGANQLGFPVDDDIGAANWDPALAFDPSAGPQIDALVLLIGTDLETLEPGRVLPALMSLRRSLTRNADNEPIEGARVVVRPVLAVPSNGLQPGIILDHADQWRTAMEDRRRALRFIDGRSIEIERRTPFGLWTTTGSPIGKIAMESDKAVALILDRDSTVRARVGVPLNDPQSTSSAGAEIARTMREVLRLPE